MGKQALIDEITDAIGANGQGAITGNILRDKLIAMVNQMYPVPGNGDGSSNGKVLKSFKNAGDLTEDQIGLLVMSQLNIINDPPEGPGDIEFVATLCNTSPGTPGVKGEYEISFPKSFPVKPRRKQIRLSFAGKPASGNISFEFPVGNTMNSFSLINSPTDFANVDTRKPLHSILDDISSWVTNNTGNPEKVYDAGKNYGLSDHYSNRGYKFTGTGANNWASFGNGFPRSSYSVTEKLNTLVTCIDNSTTRLDVFTDYNGANVGDIFTGQMSGATALIYSHTIGGYYLVCNLSGTFTPGESIINGTQGGGTPTSYDLTGVTTSPDIDIFKIEVTSETGYYNATRYSQSSNMDLGPIWGLSSLNNDSGHVIDDTWLFEYEAGAAEFEIGSITGAFQDGEIVQGGYMNKTAIVKKSAAGVIYLYDIDNDNGDMYTANNSFVYGETITGRTSGATGVLGIGTGNNTDFGDVNILLEMAGANNDTDYYTDSAIAIVDMAGNTSQATVTDIITSDEYSIASILQTSINQNRTLVTANTWDIQSGNAPICNYADVFNNSPYGSTGSGTFMFMKFFDNLADYVNAITWSLDHSSNNNFNNGFDLLSVDTTSDDFRIIFTVRTKTAPTQNNNYISIDIDSNINYQPNGFWEYFGTSNSVAPVPEVSEQVTNQVLGTLEAIDGDNVIVNVGPEFVVKLSADAIAVMPYQTTIPVYPFAIAWRNGEVIDFQGLINLGIGSDTILSSMILTRGFFNTLELAGPGDTFEAQRGGFFFGN